jgi:hypothetical protein
MNRQGTTHREEMLAVACGVVLAAIVLLNVGRDYPAVGHDFRYYIPRLLDTDLHIRINGRRCSGTRQRSAAAFQPSQTRSTCSIRSSSAHVFRQSLFIPDREDMTCLLSSLESLFPVGKFELDSG